jgi:hypothetical protein
VLDKFFRNDFEKGSTDAFPIKKPSHYGNDITDIEFWRDSAGLASDWYVDRIAIENMKTHDTFIFPVCCIWSITLILLPDKYPDLGGLSII